MLISLCGNYSYLIIMVIYVFFESLIQYYEDKETFYSCEHVLGQ